MTRQALTTALFYAATGPMWAIAFLIPAMAAVPVLAMRERW